MTSYPVQNVISHVYLYATYKLFTKMKTFRCNPFVMTNILISNCTFNSINVFSLIVTDYNSIYVIIYLCKPVSVHFYAKFITNKQSN